jgi:hypothetical protein
VPLPVNPEPAPRSQSYPLSLGSGEEVRGVACTVAGDFIVYTEGKFEFTMDTMVWKRPGAMVYDKSGRHGPFFGVSGLCASPAGNNFAYIRTDEKYNQIIVTNDTEYGPFFVEDKFGTYPGGTTYVRYLNFAVDGSLEYFAVEKNWTWTCHFGDRVFGPYQAYLEAFNPQTAIPVFVTMPYEIHKTIPKAGDDSDRKILYLRGEEVYGPYYPSPSQVLHPMLGLTPSGSAIFYVGQKGPGDPWYLYRNGEKLIETDDPGPQVMADDNGHVAVRYAQGGKCFVWFDGKTFGPFNAGGWTRLLAISADGRLAYSVKENSQLCYLFINGVKISDGMQNGIHSKAIFLPDGDLLYAGGSASGWHVYKGAKRVDNLPYIGGLEDIITFNKGKSYAWAADTGTNDTPSHYYAVIVDGKQVGTFANVDSLFGAPDGPEWGVIETALTPGGGTLGKRVRVNNVTSGIHEDAKIVNPRILPDGSFTFIANFETLNPWSCSYLVRDGKEFIGTAALRPARGGGAKTGAAVWVQDGAVKVILF